MENKRRSISENDCRLIERYCDNECSEREIAAVKDLVSENADAASYLSSIKAIHNEVVSSYSGAPDSINIWDKISRRIDEEQKLAILLGARRISTKTKIFQRFAVHVQDHVAAWGVSSAAAIAICVLLIRVLPGSNPNDNGVGGESFAKESSFGGESAGVSNVARVPVKSSAPEIFEEQIPQTMEVDWMRSKGGVRVIQNRHGSPIFWVKKREPRNIASIPMTNPPTALWVNDTTNAEDYSNVD